MTENRWAKLPEPHRALINYAAAVMREKFPPPRAKTNIVALNLGSQHPFVVIDVVLSDFGL